MLCPPIWARVTDAFVNLHTVWLVVFATLPLILPPAAFCVQLLPLPTFHKGGCWTSRADVALGGCVQLIIRQTLPLLDWLPSLLAGEALPFSGPDQPSRDGSCDHEHFDEAYLFCLQVLSTAETGPA